MIHYKCEQCGAKLASPEALGNGRDQCPGCGAVLQVTPSKAQKKAAEVERIRAAFKGTLRAAFKSTLARILLTIALLIALLVVSFRCGLGMGLDIGYDLGAATTFNLMTKETSNMPVAARAAYLIVVQEAFGKACREKPSRQ